ncbi:MAG: hypothetical protein ACRC33_08355, partial [Gemmataceae bacterium]
AAMPPRVLLTFGTRPCCVPATKDAPPAPPLPAAFYAVLGAAVLLGVATVVLMARGAPPKKSQSR